MTGVREPLCVVVAGPVVPMGIGNFKYVTAAADEFVRFAWFLGMRKKSQAARV